MGVRIGLQAGLGVPILEEHVAAVLRARPDPRERGELPGVPDSPRRLAGAPFGNRGHGPYRENREHP